MKSMVHSFDIRPPVSLVYRLSYGTYGEHCSIVQCFVGSSVAKPDKSPSRAIPHKFWNLVLWQHAEITCVSVGSTGIVDLEYLIHGTAALRKARTKILGCP